jgi:hypothetical protein
MSLGSTLYPDASYYCPSAVMVTSISRSVTKKQSVKHSTDSRLKSALGSEKEWTVSSGIDLCLLLSTLFTTSLSFNIGNKPRTKIENLETRERIMHETEEPWLLDFFVSDNLEYVWSWNVLIVGCMIHNLLRATSWNLQCTPVYHTGPNVLVDFFVVFLSLSRKMPGFYLKLIKTLTFHTILT